MVRISAERSNAREVHGRCTRGGGDKCRKVKCAGGAREVQRQCAGGVQEVVGINAERLNVQEVHGR